MLIGRHKHWTRRGYRPVTVYYWDGRYYDRPIAHRYGVRTIVVWERNGRFYQGYDRRDGHDCEHERRWDD